MPEVLDKTPQGALRSFGGVRRNAFGKRMGMVDFSIDYSVDHPVDYPVDGAVKW